MKKIVLAAMSVAIVAGVFVNCNIIDDQDYEAIKALILDDDVWFNANTVVGDSTTEDTTAVMVMAADSTAWVLWWRGPQTHGDSATVDISIEGDSAYVEWSRPNYGKIGIIAGIVRDSAQTDTIVYWEKDLVETAYLRAIFRHTRARNDYKGWELEKISCAWGASEDGTVNIDSVHIQSAQTGYDIMITDPANTFYDVTDLVSFKPQEDVTVTIYANEPNTDAFLHSFVLLWPFYVRDKFDSDGNGVHTGTWKAQLIEFPRWAIFDLMSTGTLWDGESAYDFAGVLFPYAISNQ
jgi:hypothetical protein